MPQEKKTIVIVGGGAAGFFAAVNCAGFNPDVRVIILEKSRNLLSKVKVSGGGRCNVTHACFEPVELVKYYPRGEKELLSPFHQLMTFDVIQWFEERGVALKTEEDGRMFPVTDQSQTIIDCLLQEAEKNNVRINLSSGVKSLSRENDKWILETDNDQRIYADKVMFAAGSSPQAWSLLQKLGHTIIEPVPSLFTFNIKDPRIDGLMGLSVPMAEVKILNSAFEAQGPLLITHWGMSGPAVLRLSAWGARWLSEKQYKFNITVNWLAADTADVLNTLHGFKMQYARKQVGNKPFEVEMPQRLWKQLADFLNISHLNWADLSKTQLNDLARELTAGEFLVNGKSTFKDEFVTCGGVDLKEVDMRTMESKLLKGLFFGGEILNIDAITGGFNFQAAWTTGFIAAKNMSS